MSSSRVISVLQRDGFGVDGDLWAPSLAYSSTVAIFDFALPTAPGDRRSPRSICATVREDNYV